MTTQTSNAESEEAVTLRVSQGIISAWADRDLELTLSFVSDDIVHDLNIDGNLVPIGASTEGKVALREKLQMFLDTFEFGALVTETIKIEGSIARIRLKIFTFISPPASV
jgi:hypothetical protein